MPSEGPATSGVRVRLAYLCNLYPAVSHSFVRREIEAIDQAGHEVRRFSMRPPQSGLKDQADLREAAVTEAALSQGISRLSFIALGLLLSRPAKTLAALRAAFLLSGQGIQRKLRHIAYWLEAGWLVRRMEQLEIQHLHAHFGTNPAAVAAIARAWGGPPFSFTAHGPDEFDAPGDLSLGKKIERAAFVVGISSFGRAQLMRWTDPAHWHKIKTVRCGLDEAYLSAAAAPIPGDSNEFVCVARLSAQKGLPLLIGACDELRRRGAHFKVTIIGDGELRSNLEGDIKRRDLGSHVFLAGACSSEQIRAHLERARAFVLPSFAEGLPVVLMEALAMSRPAIATAIAGIPELIDEQCGWLIPAGSEVALANAMTAALEASPEELAAKGAVGRKRVHEMHDARRNSADIVEAILTTSPPSLSVC